MSPEAILEGQGITKSYGGVMALYRVDIRLYPQEILGLIGPNGSGKTTLFNALSRTIAIDEGRVLFKGQDVTGRRPYQVARMGLSRTFQVIRVYRSLTLLENMLISRSWRHTHPWGLLRMSQQETYHRAWDLLEFFRIAHLAHEPAGNLSGGQRRLLELAMAMMPDPDVLLLDEAMSGINPALIEEIKERIRELRGRQGKTFLMVEHNIQFIADMCDRVVVLHQGQKLAEGTPQEITANEAVIEAYLGG